MKKLNKKGFTLVELLAVIVILAILAVAAMTNVIPKMEQAKLGTVGSSSLTIIENLSACMMDFYDTATANNNEICRGIEKKADGETTEITWKTFKANYTDFSGKAEVSGLSVTHVIGFKYLENGYQVNLVSGDTTDMGCTFGDAKKAIANVKKYWENGKHKYVIKCDGTLDSKTDDTDIEDND